MGHFEKFKMLWNIEKNRKKCNHIFMNILELAESFKLMNRPGRPDPKFKKSLFSSEKMRNSGNYISDYSQSFFGKDF